MSIPRPKRVPAIRTAAQEARELVWANEQAIIHAGLTAKFRPIPRIAKPKKVGKDLLAVYPVGDLHTGQLSWAVETRGPNYDLKITERLLDGAVSTLIGKAPSCEQSLITFMGDFLHFDGFRAETPMNKHMLDADCRFPKVASTAIRIARRAIDAAATHHGLVHVIWELGNHDPVSAIWMMQLLSNVYESNPRVTIDTSPSKFHYFEFGKTLIQTHHGDNRIKVDKLPLLMATDMAEAWGRTKFRWTLLGHHHHESRLDHSEVVIEKVPVLAPNDAYGANYGYRSVRQMQVVILDREDGEVERHTVRPSQLLKG